MEHLSENQNELPKDGIPEPSGIMKTKRLNYLTWEDYFMANALLSAMRSKDPNTQVGACIINEEMKIVGIGYNGMPKGCSDDDLPWDRSNSDPLANKHLYVCHAEMNAIMNKNASNVKGCTVYVTLFPCNECAKIIIQAGIKEIVYLSNKYADRPDNLASRRLLDMANIPYRQFKAKAEKLIINFSPLQDASVELSSDLPTPPGTPSLEGLHIS